jgi:tetratricopeptide (TPR) repeat protein
LSHALILSCLLSFKVMIFAHDDKRDGLPPPLTAPSSIAPASDNAKTPSVGDLVRMKPGVALVDSANRTVVADAGNRVFEVRHQAELQPDKDRWLYLAADVAGWAKESDVIMLSLDEKIDYQTNRIYADPARAWVHFNARGLLWMSKPDWDLAILDFSESISRRPSGSFEIYVNRATAYCRKGDEIALERALGDSFQAIRINPQSAGAYYIRGLAYLGQQRFDSAIADFNKTLQLDPRFPLAADARFITMKGQSLDKAIGALTSSAATASSELAAAAKKASDDLAVASKRAYDDLAAAIAKKSATDLQTASQQAAADLQKAVDQAAEDLQSAADSAQESLVAANQTTICELIKLNPEAATQRKADAKHAETVQQAAADKANSDFDTAAQKALTDFDSAAKKAQADLDAATKKTTPTSPDATTTKIVYGLKTEKITVAYTFDPVKQGEIPAMTFVPGKPPAPTVDIQLSPPAAVSPKKIRVTFRFADSGSNKKLAAFDVSGEFVQATSVYSVPVDQIATKLATFASALYDPATGKSGVAVTQSITVTPEPLDGVVFAGGDLDKALTVTFDSQQKAPAAKQ